MDEEPGQGKEDRCAPGPIALQYASARGAGLPVFDPADVAQR